MQQHIGLAAEIIGERRQYVGKKNERRIMMQVDFFDTAFVFVDIPKWTWLRH